MESFPSPVAPTSILLLFPSAAKVDLFRLSSLTPFPFRSRSSDGSESGPTSSRRRPSSRETEALPSSRSRSPRTSMEPDDSKEFPRTSESSSTRRRSSRQLQPSSRSRDYVADPLSLYVLAVSSSKARFSMEWGSKGWKWRSWATRMEEGAWRDEQRRQEKAAERKRR